MCGVYFTRLLSIFQFGKCGEVLNQTPSAFQQLILCDSQSTQSKDLQLRFIIFGGEALNPRMLTSWFGRHGDEKPRVVNMYGITETTVHVTWYRVTAADVERGSIIGKPLDDWRVYILDRKQRLVPQGIAGEIHVGGAGVARGYLNREQLTRERFIANPFDSDPQARLYKSGDVGRLLSDGNIEYLGRLDNQVKVRGFRVELGEIEMVLSQHPSIREAAVILKEGADHSKTIVAYLRCDPSLPPVADLRTFLRQKLPEYMIPAEFLVLDQFPLTSNGKLDRHALTTLATSRLPEVDYVSPRNAVEEVLAGIWSGVLDRNRIGINDNFFDIGGHSLLATQIMAHIRSTLRIDLPLRRLFEAPTIERLAQVILADETTPGQIDKIARVVMKLAHMSAEEAGRMLEQKKKQEREQS
jgi:hypothetical protein